MVGGKQTKQKTLLASSCLGGSRLTFFIIGTQILVTISDLIGRSVMKERGFTLTSFMSGWFVLYLFIRQIATMGQLYVFANIEFEKKTALFEAASIILSNKLSKFTIPHNSPLVH